MLGTEHEGHHSLTPSARATFRHTKSNPKQHFESVKAPVSRCFKDKGPEKSWRSQILRYYPVTLKTVLPSVFLLWQDFSESTGGGKKRTQNKICEQLLLSQGGVFQRSQCPFTHQFTLISTLRCCLCTRSFAQKPLHKSTAGGWGGGFILENPHFLIQGRWQQWLQQELSFLTYLFVLFDTVWFSLPKFSLHLM